MSDITSVKEGPACGIASDSYRLIQEELSSSSASAGASTAIITTAGPARRLPLRQVGARYTELDGLRTARAGAALAGVGVATAEPAAASAPPASSLGAGMDGLQNRSRAYTIDACR